MLVTKAVSQSPMGWLKTVALENLSDSGASSASENQGVRAYDPRHRVQSTHM